MRDEFEERIIYLLLKQFEICENDFEKINHTLSVNITPVLNLRRKFLKIRNNLLKFFFILSYIKLLFVFTNNK